MKEPKFFVALYDWDEVNAYTNQYLKSQSNGAFNASEVSRLNIMYPDEIVEPPNQTQTMKVVVTGTRKKFSALQVRQAISDVETHFKAKINELVTGHESDVDEMAITWAMENSIPVKGFPCINNTEERTKRSIAMGKTVDVCIFLWDGQSYGTKTAIEQCEENSIKYFVWKLQP